MRVKLGIPTLDLTLHPSTKTATLSGSSVTDWELVKTEGTPSQAVSNTLLLHWPTMPQGTTPDQVIFTIGGADYPVSNGITYANHTFTVSFASSVLRYPYTISNITFYQAGRLVQSCANLLGATSYKSGTMTVGINPSAIRIGNLWWATGSLVASNAVAGAHGLGGCRIGKPMDGGLYFQFGSLIGYKGGALANGGTGSGMPDVAWNSKSWNGEAAWGWENDAMVWPIVMTPTLATWPQDATTNQWYFGLQVGWNDAGQNIRDFPNLATGGLANVGVGDPCSYYLGGNWRLPTVAEYRILCNNIDNGGIWADADGAWTYSSTNGGYLAGTRLFFPASGYRGEHTEGGFSAITSHGYYSASSIYSTTAMNHWAFNPVNIFPLYGSSRSKAMPVRCVSN